MNTLDTQDALLAAIRADPDSDVPRLVYTDWLQEHGQEVRAEFIRDWVWNPCDVNADSYWFRQLAAGLPDEWLEFNSFDLRSWPGMMVYQFQGIVYEMINFAPVRIREFIFEMTKGFFTHLTLRWENWLAFHEEILASPMVVLRQVRLVTRPDEWVNHSDALSALRERFPGHCPNHPIKWELPA